MKNFFYAPLFLGFHSSTLQIKEWLTITHLWCRTFRQGNNSTCRIYTCIWLYIYSLRRRWPMHPDEQWCEQVKQIFISFFFISCWQWRLRLIYNHVTHKLTFCFPSVRLIFKLLIKPKIKKKGGLMFVLNWYGIRMGGLLVLLRSSIGNHQSLNYLIND